MPEGDESNVETLSKSYCQIIIVLNVIKLTHFNNINA